MITKIIGEQPFQVLANNFSISPSNEGYTLQISADGKQYSNLFTVGAGVTRLVTGVAANSYYRLSGNQSNVSINWMKTCVTEGGGDSSELQPIDYFPLDAVEGTVISYTGSSSASGVYQFDGNEWTEVGAVDLSPYWTSAETVNYVDSAISGISLDDYWTSAETQSAITAVEDHLYDVEEVTASALTELHDNIQELSGTTSSIQDKFSAYTPTTGFSTINGSAITNGGDIVIQGGGGGSTEEIELPIAAAVNDLKSNIDVRLDQQYYKKKEVDNIAARKTEPYQVDAQIKEYVDPAIAEVNDKIEDKELPVSAALNDLNTNKVSGVGITKIQSISQADYDALAVKDPTTFYVIL